MIRKAQVKSIIAGWSNWALDQMGMLDPMTKSMAEKRLKICDTCPDRKDSKCGLCGCYLPAKTADQNARCAANPNKW